MPLLRSIQHPKRGVLSGLFALIAMVAQLVVAVAPLAEGRDGRMASHVEATGAQSHYTHNDATCAACQARSIHGTTTRQSVPLLADELTPSQIARAAERIVEGSSHRTDNPRAPPAVI
jgi:hypothetical protein